MLFFFSKGSFGRSFGNNIIITIRGRGEDTQGLRMEDVEETGGHCFLRFTVLTRVRYHSSFVSCQLSAITMLLLRVPWTARRSNQSILKEINSEYSLEGLMLKLQYFGHLMKRADSLEKTLMLGKIKGRRRRGNRGWDGWMASLTQWTRVWANSGWLWRAEESSVW